MSDPQAGGTTNQPGDGEDPSKGGQQGDPSAQPAAGGADPNAKPQGEAGKDGDQGKADYKFEPIEGVEFDQARLGEFSAIAKELGLTNEAAQKLVTWEANRLKSQADAYVKSQQEWLDELKADKDLGGDKLDEATAVARKAIALGSPELKRFLNDTGLGNHPLLFKWAHTVGRKLSEDTLEGKGSDPGSNKPFFEASPELKP